MRKEVDEIRRGRHAQQLLEDDLFREAFRVIREEMLRAWEESPARDVEGRETLYLSLKMLERVRGYLQEVAATGQLAGLQTDDPSIT
jgi:hypothetical protein